MAESCFCTKPYVIGVGAANVDIHGRSRGPINMHDSNPGHMNSSPGGVTRNVCENLARLGADVRLISAVGGDVYGDLIRRECVAAGMDISNLYLVPDHPSSTYISILDDEGDMFVALSDMSILRKLPPAWLTERQELLRNAAVVTCDPALHPDTMERLLNLCEGHTPVYVDPVSTAYARVVAPFIGRFHTCKPNAMELEILSGLPVTDRASMLRAGERVLAAGVHRLFISIGREGCLYMDDQGVILSRKLRPLEQMVNATGAGDSFMAGVIYSTLSGFDIQRTLDYGLAAGTAAICHEKTINPNICVSYIESIIKEYSL